MVHLAEPFGNLGLLITDFTTNESIRADTRLGNRGLWCMSTRIGPDIKQQLLEGTYWTIKNIRLKRASTGDLEGDIYDVKWTKLDPSVDAQDEPLLSLLS